MKYECVKCGKENESDALNEVFFRAGEPTDIHLDCECGWTTVLRAGLKNSSTEYKDPAWLQSMYEEKSMSMATIAEMCGVSPMTIYSWLKRHGIETRRRGQR